MSLTRHYTDVNGQERKIKHVRTVAGLIGYRKTEDGVVYSPASLWELEDGSVVQIPEEAWSFCSIAIKDEVVLK